MVCQKYTPYWAIIISALKASSDISVTTIQQIAQFWLADELFSQNVRQVVGAKVWTSYLSYSKSKPKITPITEVIRVRILWLGLVNLFQTFEDLESAKDKQVDIQAVRQVIDDCVTT